MALHLTIDLRAVLIGLIALLLAAALATPIALSLADDQHVSNTPAAALGPAFTYQGRLDGDSVPVDGPYDLQLRLFQDAGGNLPVPGTTPVTLDDVQVTNGLFSVGLDFGITAFNGQALFLEIRVRPGAQTSGYTVLSPLQRLSPTPYAIWSANGPFWNLGGNAGTSSANFVGTTDLGPLELRVNNQRALRIEPGLSPNIIGGKSINQVTAGVVGATIGGGGGILLACQVQGSNSVRDDFGTVSGGCGNQAGGGVDGGYGATVGGGTGNIADGQQAFVGGGNENRASSYASTVGGGANNVAGGPYGSTVGGGYFNEATDANATIGGGYGNKASSGVATVGGGLQNQATGNGATVAGGYHNVASGPNAMIAGGSENSASGSGSFAGGTNAHALANGIFAWADNTGAAFNESLANTFNVRATGGVGFQLGLQQPNPWSCVVFNGNSGWSCSSDRNLKTKIVDLDGRDVLAKLDTVPILQWTAKDVENATPHIGPMAQDFFAAFALGDSDKLLNSGDVGGVALAAIQSLHAITSDQEERIAALEAKAGDAGGPVEQLPSASVPTITTIRETEWPSSPILWALIAAIGMFALGLFSVAWAVHTHQRRGRHVRVIPVTD